MEPTQSKFTNKVLSAQSREIVANVVKFMKREAEINNVVVPFQQVQLRTAEATGVSKSTVKRIEKQMRAIQGGESSSFETKHNKSKVKSKSEIDDFDTCVLRRLIHNFYITEKIVPTLKTIHSKFQNDVGYSGSVTSLRRILHKIGFTWKKNQDKQKAANGTSRYSRSPFTIFTTHEGVSSAREAHRIHGRKLHSFVPYAPQIVVR